MWTVKCSTIKLIVIGNDLHQIFVYFGNKDSNDDVNRPLSSSNVGRCVLA